jgi:uncharacterized lipoprotein YmbA
LKSLLTGACALTLLSACATSRPDHFYILSALPPGVSDARVSPAAPVTLKVTLPAWADRSEMILNPSADTVAVLEHERWAAPLADLVTQTLARDIERRRRDVLVAEPGAGQSGSTAIKVTVDVVQITVRRGERASIEAHWRIFDPRTGKEAVGGEMFNAALPQASYAAIAQALSECVGALADRLAEQM